ncbi:MAG: hypothetical protein HRT47_06265 [Candidatus Caenarcaniphilales bacterium]|nr:hypothetical protein [Candidatus Caenarcaniphilales bacterium]
MTAGGANFDNISYNNELIRLGLVQKEPVDENDDGIDDNDPSNIIDINKHPSVKYAKARQERLEQAVFQPKKQFAEDLANKLGVSIDEPTPKNVASIISELQFLASQISDEEKESLYGMQAPGGDPDNLEVEVSNTSEIGSLNVVLSSEYSFLGEGSGLLDEDDKRESRRNNSGSSFDLGSA